MMRPRFARFAFSALLAGACSHPPPVTSADAQSLRRALEAIAGAPEDMWMRLEMQMCSETPSCAAGRARELEAAARPEMDDSQRAAILAQGFADWREAHDRGVGLQAWWRTRFAAYAERARAAVPPAERAGLDAARDRVGLGAKSGR